MNRLLFVGTVGLVLSGVSAPARAFCRSTTCVKDCMTDPNTSCTIEGIPIAWPGPCVSYSVHRDGSSSISQADLGNAIDAAFRAWQETTCPLIRMQPTISVGDDFGVVACARVEYNRQQANANVVVMRESWEGDSNVLALTTVSIDKETGDIFDVDMEINGTQPLSVGPLSPNRFDLQSIITHEAGHFLGLGHSTTGLADNCRNGATMCRSALPGVDDFRTLDEDDIAGICTVYPPTESTAVCDPTPRRGFSAECGMDPISGGSCSLAASPRRSSAGVMTALVLGFGVVIRWLRRPRQRAQKLT